MNTHVLIVDSNTLKHHLEFLFFGTGARDNTIDFNDSPDTQLYATTENMLVSMIADGMRIRSGDNIIFYLQQNISEGILEGQFFGIFRATNNGVFLDNFHVNETLNHYLYEHLDKSLTFRNLIEPIEVYPTGVTEWEALDEIRFIQSPHQMLWSLIYRKLKGNRGNTMITRYEADRLIHLIRAKNNQVGIDHDHRLTFDSTSQQITATDMPKNSYGGTRDNINLLPRLISKYNNNRAYEAHLQGYITQNIGLGINLTLDSLVHRFNDYRISWLGNEVSCGVGMQRIDIAIELETREPNPRRIIMPIELKARYCQADDVRQISRYVNWLEQYYLPNRPCQIQPVLLGKNQSHKSQNFISLKERIIDFNNANINRTLPILYLETTIDDHDLYFEEIPYQ